MPDLHAWIVQNGEIKDFTFEEYAFTRELMKCTDKPCYESFDIKKQIKCAAYIKKQIDKRKMVEGDNWDKWLDAFYIAPVKGMCYYNALAYKKYNPNTKIVFGKFGWIRTNGKPYWEYGDSDNFEYSLDMNYMFRC